MKITWQNITVKIGQLKPWENNPKFSTIEQAKRIEASWKKWGQVTTIAVDKKFNVIDGHQRLSVLKTLYGDEYEVDVRQCSIATTEDMRKELVITLTSGAVGSLDWEKLKDWNPEELVTYGLDKDTLERLNKDAENLNGLLSSLYEFEPNKSPEIGSVNFDAGDVNKKNDQLHDRFQDGAEYITMTCPHCGEDFLVNEKDVKNGTANSS
jgi:hypothetical protein